MCSAAKRGCPKLPALGMDHAPTSWGRRRRCAWPNPCGTQGAPCLGVARQGSMALVAAPCARLGLRARGAHPPHLGPGRRLLGGLTLCDLVGPVIPDKTDATWHKKASHDARLSLYPGWESNPHSLRNASLSRARLPIPPPGPLGKEDANVSQFSLFTMVPRVLALKSWLKSAC